MNKQASYQNRVCQKTKESKVFFVGTIVCRNFKNMYTQKSIHCLSKKEPFLLMTCPRETEERSQAGPPDAKCIIGTLGNPRVQGEIAIPCPIPKSLDYLPQNIPYSLILL